MNFPPAKSPPTLSAITARSARTGEADVFEIFEALVANSQDIFFSLSSQGALEYVSPQWSVQLGYPPQEVIGRYFTDFVDNPEECRQAFRQGIKKAGTASDIEVRFRTNDGRVLRYLAHARPDRGPEDEIRRVVGVAKNVTVLLEVQEQLRESEHRYRSLLESLADPAVVYDLEGGCQYLNPAFRQVFGWTLEEFQDKQIPFVPEEEVGPTMDKIKGIIERGDAVSQFASKRLTKDGRLLDIVISASRFYDTQGRPAGLSAILRDVTEQQRLERELADRLVELMEVKSQLESQADELTRLNAEMMLANQRLTELSLTDHLTGLHNHRSFQERVDQEIKRVRRYKTPLSLIMADLDNFKHYNDTFGHQAGDQVLRDLATNLVRSVRETDFVARYGGEEFCILLPQTEANSARVVAEKVRIAVEHQFCGKHGQPECALTISLGISCFTPNMTKVQFIELADRALYESKTNGRNQCTLAPECLMEVEGA